MFTVATYVRGDTHTVESIPCNFAWVFFFFFFKKAKSKTPPSKFLKNACLTSAPCTPHMLRNTKLDKPAMPSHGVIG